MNLRDEYSAAYDHWQSLNLYEKFEHVVILVLIGLIAIVVVSAVSNLALKVVGSLVLSQSFDPTDHVVFQGVFGMIFTVIIALEFKRSLLLVTERKQAIIQVRAVVLIALLAIVRKLIIFDFATSDSLQLFALSVATVALGGVYWLVRDQDRRDLG
jgi:uncharacterized membrane protein (DUF373 family)